MTDKGWIFVSASARKNPANAMIGGIGMLLSLRSVILQDNLKNKKNGKKQEDDILQKL